VNKKYEILRKFFIEKFGEDITKNKDLDRKLMLRGVQRLM
jgi:hypothetical protein